MVTGGKTFEGETIVLNNDIDLFSGYMEDGDPVSTAPVGKRDYSKDFKPFKGEFDGQGHIIKNLYQNGWALGYWDGKYGAIGLFARVEDATIKNLTVENFELRVEGGNVGAVVGNAAGDCTFENITVKNGTVCSYNNGAAGIVAWPEDGGKYIFKNIVLEEDFTVAAFWGTYDASLGGVIAEAYPGAEYHFEDIEINCRLDAYNDVCANYQWWAYRYSGMVVGNVDATQDINGRTVADPNECNITCENVVVNYGDWMNYHYCESESYGEPSYADQGEWKFKRVEAGYSYEGIDHTQCNHDSDESHNELIPFNQLFGGNGQGVYGLAEYDGVTVNYPKSYVKEVGSAADLKSAIEKGLNVVLSEDVDYGTDQLAVTKPITIDLGGHTLTTNMTYGGISLKKGASIKNGTIKHTSTVAAIKAFNVGSIENVAIKTTCETPNKTITAIAVQQGGHVGTIKNVTIEGVSQGIEVGYQATVDLIEDVEVAMRTNGTANGIGMVINGGKVGKAKGCTFAGDVYGINMQLKGVFHVGLELEKCTIKGETASIYAWDEKIDSNGNEIINNVPGASFTLTYDATTKLEEEPIWDFSDECKSVVTLNEPE